eukprot:1832563-Alexandrium_andersonii.AAC.1
MTRRTAWPILERPGARVRWVAGPRFPTGPLRTPRSQLGALAQVSRARTTAATPLSPLSLLRRTT